MALDLLGEIVGSSSPEGVRAVAASVYDPLASLPHHNHHHNLHESPDHVFAAHQTHRGIPPSSYYSTPSRSRNPDSTETVSERQQQHYMRDYGITESGGGRGGSTNVNEPRRETMMSNYNREQSSDMFSSQTSLELLGTPSIMPFVRDRNACDSVSSFGVATDKGEIVNGVGVAVGPPPNFNPLLFGNEQAPEDALQSYLLRNGYPNNNNSNNNNNAANLGFGAGFNHTAAQDAIHADGESFFRNSHRALNPSIMTLPHALPHPQATNAWLNSNNNNPVLLPGGEEDWQLRNMNAPLKNILQAEPLSGVNMGYSSHHSLSLSLSSPADRLRSSYQNWDWRLSHAGSFSLMRNSKYLKPVQHLLDEFCNVRVTTRKNPGKPHEASSLQSMQEENTPFQQSRGSTSTNMNINNNNSSSSKQQLNGGAESSMANSKSEVKVSMSESQMQVSIKADTHQHGAAGPEKQLHPEERSQLQMKKTRLISMVEEVDRRYRQYRDHLQTVITSFESATGLGGAAPYTTLARQTMSRHFKCLRDAISNEIRAICGTLGEEPSNVPVLTRGETPRLRILDQQLRHQRSLHQMGMLQQQPWRPQRGLPERAVSVLRAWLFEHFLHPYPKDSEKLMLARQTGLTRNQVSNWFINARVRLWKPMVEEMYVEEQKDLSSKSLQEGSRGKDERGNGMRDQKSMREVGSISSNWQQQGFSQGFESEKGSEEAPINMEGEVDMVQQYRSENMFVRDEQAMFMEALQENPYHMSDGHMESNNNSRNMKSHFVLDSLQYGQGVDGRGLMQAGPSSTGISLTLGLQQHTASLLGDGPHAYNDAIHMNNSQW